MAGYVAYKKATFDAASAVQRSFLKTIINNLGLGDPALFETPAGEEWYVFADRRVDARFVENLAWANGIIADIATSPVRDYPTTGPHDEEVPVYEWVTVPVTEPVFDENGDIVDEVPVLDENGDPVTVQRRRPTGGTQIIQVDGPLGDPLTLAADAQGAVAWFTARTELPAGLTPVSGGV